MPHVHFTSFSNNLYRIIPTKSVWFYNSSDRGNICYAFVHFFFAKPVRTVITISVTGNESAGFASAAAAGLAASRNELVFFLFFFLGLRREFFYIPCIIALIPCV